MGSTGEEEQENYDQEAFIVEGISLLIVGLIGILGNVSAILVFSRQSVQKNFHALMVSLSAFDLLYILGMILVFSIKELNNDYIVSGVYYYLLPWVLPFIQIGMTGSIYFTMAITVERYVTVCHPFYRVSHSWPAKVLVIPIVAFAVLYNIPKFFELRTKVPGEEYDNIVETLGDINSTVLNGTMEPLEVDTYGIAPTVMRMNPYYVKITMWLNFLLMGLGPFILLISLNMLTLMQLQKMAKESHMLTGPDGRNRKKDIILCKVSLAIVFVFIVCHSIKWIPNIYELLQVGSGEIVWPSWIETVTHFSHLLTTFNSSVNFYIYFAKHWRSILGIQEPSQPQPTEAFTLRQLDGCSARASLTTCQRVANNHQEPGEETTMLVHVVINNDAPSSTNIVEINHHHPSKDSNQQNGKLI